MASVRSRTSPSNSHAARNRPGSRPGAGRGSGDARPGSAVARRRFRAGRRRAGGRLGTDTGAATEGAHGVRGDGRLFVFFAFSFQVKIVSHIIEPNLMVSSNEKERSVAKKSSGAESIDAMLAECLRKASLTTCASYRAAERIRDSFLLGPRAFHSPKWRTRKGFYSGCASQWKNRAHARLTERGRQFVIDFDDPELPRIVTGRDW